MKAEDVPLVLVLERRCSGKEAQVVITRAKAFKVIVGCDRYPIDRMLIRPTWMTFWERIW